MASFNLTKLVNRKLIKISGPDCYPYLQSLLSNDLRYLYEPDRIPKRKHAVVSPNVLSTFMLNAQGRVICDILLYRTPLTKYECKFSQPGEAKDPDELLIECDASIANGLANTLYAYRVRRKVSLAIEPNLDIWCLYPRLITEKHGALGESGVNTIQGINSGSLADEMVENNLTIVCDPRLNMMGLRIVSNASLDYTKIKDELEKRFNISDIKESSINKYILHKYKMGISEGADDHPEGNCLPLECNADVLGSVSFDKGCYLGQELTARIHYTGVIRKRLMPTALMIDKSKPPPELPFAAGSDVVDATNETSTPMHEATKVPMAIWRPFWWDVDASASE